MSGPPVDPLDMLFDQFFGGGAATGDPLSEMDQLRMGTAGGRRDVNFENIQANIDKLTELRKKVGPDQQKRLDKLIKGLKEQMGGMFTRPNTDDQGVISNVARGVATGVANVAPGVADMALTLPSLLPDAVGGAVAGRARDRLQETMALNQEVINPQGAAGALGELGGGIAAGIPAYGPLARGSAHVIAKVAPGLKPILTGGVEGTRAHRAAVGAAGNVIAGAPLNVLQGISMGDTQQGLMTGAIGLGADALFGAAMPGPQIRPGVKPAKVSSSDELIRREVEANEIIAKAAAKKAANRAKIKNEAAAREEWKQGNPGKKWSDLKALERKAIYESYHQRNPIPEPAPPPPKPADESSATGHPVPTEEQLVNLRRAHARAKADLDADPGNADKQAQFNTLEGMRSRLDPQVKDPEAPTELAPAVQMVQKRQQLLKILRMSGIEHDPNASIEDLGRILMSADTKPKTAKDAITKLGLLQSEMLQLKAIDEPSVAEATRMADIRTEMEQVRSILGRIQSGVAEPPTPPSESVTGQRGANAGPSGASVGPDNIPGNLRAQYNTNKMFKSLVDKIRAGERVNPIALKSFPELQLQYGEQVAARWKQPVTPVAPKGEAPAPVDPIEARLAALKRGEKLTPDLPQTGGSIEDLLPEILKRHKYDSYNMFDRLDQAQKRFAAYQEIQPFLRQLADPEDSSISPEMRQKMQDLIVAVQKDTDVYGHHLTGNPRDIPSEDGIRRMKLQENSAVKNSIEQQIVPTERKAAIQALDDELLKEFTDDMLRSAKHNDGGLPSYREDIAIDLFTEARRRGRDIPELPVREYDVNTKEWYMRPLGQKPTRAQELGKRQKATKKVDPHDEIDITGSSDDEIDVMLKMLVERNQLGQPMDGPTQKLVLDVINRPKGPVDPKLKARLLSLMPTLASMDGKVVGEITHNKALSPEERVQADYDKMKASLDAEKAATDAMAPEAINAEIASLQEKLGYSDLGEVLTRKYNTRIQELQAALSRKQAPAGGTTTPEPTPSPRTTNPAATASEPSTSPTAKPAGKFQKMAEADLDKLEDTVDAIIPTLKPDSPEHAEAVKTLDDIMSERIRRRQTGEMAPVDSPIKQEVKIKKDKDFANNGEYIAKAGKQEVRFFYDKERRMWYKINPGSKDPHSYIGTTKADAIERLSLELGGDVVTQPLPEPAPKVKAPKTAKAIEADAAVLAEKTVLPPKFNIELATKPVSSLTDNQLESVINHYVEQQFTVADPARRTFLDTKLTRAQNELAKRKNPSKGPDNAPPTGDGLRVQSSPTVGVFVGTAGISWYNTDPDDPDRLSKAFMWGLGTAAPFGAGRYLIARRRAMGQMKRSNLLRVRGGEAGLPKRMINEEELVKEPTNLLQRLRASYTGMVRSSYGMNYMMESIGRGSTAAERNPAKLMLMWGRYIARTEQFVTGNGRLTYEDVNTGEPVIITNEVMAQHGLRVDPETGDSPRGLAYILGMAEGDKDALGQLAVAYASLEGSGRGSVPMPVEEAKAIIMGASPQLVTAVRELRKYNMALMLAANKAGRLSLQGLQAMGEEDWYTPFQRVAKNLEELNRRTGKNTVAQPNPIAARKGGSKLPVLNPYDVAHEMTRRVLRANEYGQILNSFIVQMKSLPQNVRNQILEPVSNRNSPKVHNIEKAVEDLRNTVRISQADARSMLAYVDDTNAFGAGRDGIMHVFEDGALKSYRVKRPELLEAFKSMAPTELDMMMRLIGMPARIASKGVVYNPVFISRMAFIDSFQAFLGSKYGFRPGIDQLRGFLHAAFRSEKYQKLLDVGGPATLQSLSYIDPHNAAMASRTAGVRAIDTAINNLKEFKIVEAWKSLINPVAESARVGEYLRALDHGASTIEAAYAAWDVVGNPRMQGSFATIRKFHYATMFSRPAMAAIDKLVMEMGIGPVAPEYNKTMAGRAFQRAEVDPRIAGALTVAVKGFAGITLPSLALWYANKDDEEITKFRQTESGQLYWFIRNPQTREIMKVRKPHVIGQIFGSAAEAWADNQVKEDPDNFTRVLEGLVNDAAINTLPQLGVITYGLWANKQPGLGGPLSPMRDETLAPELRGYSRASLPARLVADKLAGVTDRIDSETLRRAMSPAGIDYIVRNLTGMLGEDALQIVGHAVEYAQEGYIPPKDEFVMVSRYMQKNPSMNIRPVRNFYDRDRKVTEVARTIDHLQRNNPEQLERYIERNIRYLPLIEVHKKTRTEVANFRRAIEDIRNMPASYGEKRMRRQVEDAFIQSIEAAVLAADAMWDATIEP